MIAPHFQFSLNGSHGGAVPLLPRCVPDLQICLLAIHQHPLHLEINPWEQKRKEKQIYISELKRVPVFNQKICLPWHAPSVV